MVAKEMKKTKVVMTKPIYLGLLVLDLSKIVIMAISVHRSCRRTHGFKNWRRKESYDKKSYDLKWQGVDKIFLQYFHNTLKTLIKNIYKNTLTYVIT